MTAAMTGRSTAPAEAGGTVTTGIPNDGMPRFASSVRDEMKPCGLVLGMEMGRAARIRARSYLKTVDLVYRIWYIMGQEIKKIQAVFYRSGSGVEPVRDWLTGYAGSRSPDFGL